MKLNRFRSQAENGQQATLIMLHPSPKRLQKIHPSRVDAEIVLDTGLFHPWQAASSQAARKTQDAWRGTDQPDLHFPAEVSSRWRKQVAPPALPVVPRCRRFGVAVLLPPQVPAVRCGVLSPDCASTVPCYYKAHPAKPNQPMRRVVLDRNPVRTSVSAFSQCSPRPGQAVESSA